MSTGTIATGGDPGARQRTAPPATSTCGPPAPVPAPVADTVTVPPGGGAAAAIRRAPGSSALTTAQSSARCRAHSRAFATP